MDAFTGVIAFLMIWWTSLFAVLPWGNRVAEKPEQGHATSAPANPRIKTKFLATTGISIVLWLILYILIQLQIVDFFNIAEEMMIKDEVQ